MRKIRGLEDASNIFSELISECITTFNLIFIHLNLWKLMGLKIFSFVAVTVFFTFRSCSFGHLFNFAVDLTHRLT